MAESDWRLRGQEKYLTGIMLVHRRWSGTEEWDHDHCVFCGAKFMAEEYPDTLHEGWTTADEMHWICDTCFNDFRKQFGWLVASPEQP